MKFRNFFVCGKCKIMRYHDSEGQKEIKDNCIECDLIPCIYLNSIDKSSFID